MEMIGLVAEAGRLKINLYVNMQKFHDRYHAGKVLAEKLQMFANREDVSVLALPRGGVPVAYEIAKSLQVPWDVFIVRKLGMPGQEELAMGAIASGEICVFNEDILKEIPVSKSAIDDVIQIEKNELKRREIVYRGHRPSLILKDKTLILVDDGIATGATMRAAIQALRQQNPISIIVAVPVAALSTYKEIELLVDQIVCPLKPEHFYAVGAWYDEFPQTSDEEVSFLLNN
jgi:putative phosphoribosyl transferase